jgi:hypothetical protein
MILYYSINKEVRDVIFTIMSRWIYFESTTRTTVEFSDSGEIRNRHDSNPNLEDRNC